MRFAVLGTGMAGTTIGSTLVELGHEVRLGSRAPGSERSSAWVAETGDGASEGALADAAAFGEVVINCTAGAGSLDALRAAGEENLADKVLIDVANPLDSPEARSRRSRSATTTAWVNGSSAPSRRRGW